MLKTVRKFSELGFSVIWLQPYSKRPIEKNWTITPKKTFKELKLKYRAGNNAGVRLGKTSKFPDGSYLAVIDCDVKSDNPKYLTQLEQKLNELGVTKAPTVLSGRGNGSKHLYIRTKDLLYPRRFAQCPEKVQVLMPSVNPTPKEKAILTLDEIEEGYRLRAAWEISIMGEGQQVVLPPSIHPDTNEPYTWVKEIQNYKDIPLVEIKNDAESLNDKPKLKDFVALEVDLSRLNKKIRDEIVDGDGVSDRSASLFKACASLVREGYGDQEILTVLTDENYYLGKASFDHAKTQSRLKAANWINKYTLAKVKKEASASEIFKSEVVETVLNEEDSEKQLAAINKLKPWESKLERTSEQSGARPKSTVFNLNLIMENTCADVFRFNNFTVRIEFEKSPPWRTPNKRGEMLKDIDVINCVAWLADSYRLDFSSSKVLEAIHYVAGKNLFNPVENYLRSLVWDGTPRINTWLKDYLNAEAAEPYLSAVSRKVLCAMVARALYPGVKFDQVLILEGVQGKGKSTTASILAGEWFTDAHTDMHNKDSIINMMGVWVVELGELSGMRKADIDLLKEFISRRVDRLRLPYGKIAQDFPRHCIFIGTTNSNFYLKDPSGNRRFWPVTVNNITHQGLDNLRRDRDQLLAEALIQYELLDEPLYLTDADEIEGSMNEQNARVLPDIIEEKLRDFLQSEEGQNMMKKGFSFNELFSPFSPFKDQQSDRSTQYRVATILKNMGFEKHRIMRNGVREIVFLRRNRNLN